MIRILDPRLQDDRVVLMAERTEVRRSRVCWIVGERELGYEFSQEDRE